MTQRRLCRRRRRYGPLLRRPRLSALLSALAHPAPRLELLSLQVARF